jgi:hypothetical protein
MISVMAAVHIAEREAVRDFRAVLSRLDAGDDVLIDRDGSTVSLRSTPTRGKTVAEAIAILKSRSNLPSGDTAFADDIERAMNRMRSLPSYPSPWD